MEVDFVGLAQDFILVAIDFMGEIEDKTESTCQKRLVSTVHISYEVTTYKTSVIKWYKAPSWTKHVIDNNLGGPKMVWVADMDGDNDLDVVVVDYNVGDIV